LGTIDAVAVDCSGQYIVGDNFGNLLRVSPGGTISLIQDGFGSVDAVAVDGSCNYIVGDNFGNLIRVLPDGDTSIIVSGLGNIKGLAIDSGRPVAVIDFGIDDLLKVTSTGMVFPVIGTIFIAIGGIAFPIDSTSLVVANVQANLFWWMPMVIAGIVLSVLLIKKKRTVIKTLK